MSKIIQLKFKSQRFDPALINIVLFRGLFIHDDRYCTWHYTHLLHHIHDIHCTHITPLHCITSFRRTTFDTSDRPT
jgi:hypothetical protein